MKKQIKLSLSIDEAAKEHEQQFGFNSEGELNSSPAESFKAGADFCSKLELNFAQRWISVDDELPKKGDRVLLKDKNGEVECLLIYNDDYVTVLMERFTHWRYLELK